MARINCKARRTHLSTKNSFLFCGRKAVSEFCGVALCQTHLRQATHWQLIGKAKERIKDLWGIEIDKKK
jgi:hypothetical protein